MHVLYESDRFAVMRIDAPVLEGHAWIARGRAEADLEGHTEGPGARPGHVPVLTQGGFEIVDKLAQQDTFLHGAMAQTFLDQAQALMSREPSPEEIEEFIGRYTVLSTRPLTMH